MPLISAFTKYSENFTGSLFCCPSLSPHEIKGHELNSYVFQKQNCKVTKIDAKVLLSLNLSILSIFARMQKGDLICKYLYKLQRPFSANVFRGC